MEFFFKNVTRTNFNIVKNDISLNLNTFIPTCHENLENNLHQNPLKRDVFLDFWLISSKSRHLKLIGILLLQRHTAHTHHMSLNNKKRSEWKYIYVYAWRACTYIIYMNIWQCQYQAWDVHEYLMQPLNEPICIPPVYLAERILLMQAKTQCVMEHIHLRVQHVL